LQENIRCIRGREQRAAVRVRCARILKELASSFLAPCTDLYHRALRGWQEDAIRGRRRRRRRRHEKGDDGGGGNNNNHNNDDEEDGGNETASLITPYFHANNQEQTTPPIPCSSSQSLEEMLGLALARLERSLPGANFYVGLLQPGGDALLYHAASPPSSSSMPGRLLKRGSGGVSFDCIGPGFSKRGVVVTEEEDEVNGQRVRCFHDEDAKEAAKREARNEAEKQRMKDEAAADVVKKGTGGMGGGVTRVGAGGADAKAKVDAKAALKKIKNKNKNGTGPDDDGAGVSVGRGGPGQAGNGVWPFIVVPLVSGGGDDDDHNKNSTASPSSAPLSSSSSAHTPSVVGVLGCDDFSFVGKGRSDEQHPEMGVLDMLCSAGKDLGRMVDQSRKAKSLREIVQAARLDTRWYHVYMHMCCIHVYVCMIGRGKH
jgi:hypothetical protein